MLDEEIKLIPKRLGRNRFAVSLIVSDKVKVAKELNPFKAEERAAFIAEVTSALPGLNGEVQKIEEELLQLTKPEQKRRLDAKQSGLPQIIIVGRQMPAITADALKAMAAKNNPPVVFTRGGTPTRLRVNDDGSFALHPMNEAAMRGRIGRVASYFSLSKEQELIPRPPPLDVVRDILAMDLSPADFPPIEAITRSPVIRPDWSILDTEGYDAATRLYYQPDPRLKLPEIPTQPQQADAFASVQLLDEAFGEFPYAADADRANALATAITPVIRQIVGKSPLALSDAPQAGTGKSLWADAIGLLITGDNPAMMGAPDDENEWRKQITATLLPGPTIVVIDNICETLSSAHLARVLTANIWSDRVLGLSQKANIRNVATWIGTGNNIALGGDLPRRCYRIRLDAKTARPWRGRYFTHPNLLEWVSSNRGRLLAAILTLARAWHVAGRPVGPSPILGSFEEWSRTVGGILYFAGVGGFLANLEEMYEEADSDSDEWEHFLSAWHDRYQDTPVTVGQILTDVQDATADKLRDALPEPLSAFVSLRPAAGFQAAAFHVRDAGRFKIKLGKQLKTRVGRRYGSDGLHLRRTEDSHTKVAIWAVRKTESAGSAGNSGESLSLCAGEIATFSDSSPLFEGNTPATPSTPRNPTADDLFELDQVDPYAQAERDAIQDEVKP